jgi:hypothetical protein
MMEKFLMFSVPIYQKAELLTIAKGRSVVSGQLSVVGSQSSVASSHSRLEIYGRIWSNETIV